MEIERICLRVIDYLWRALLEELPSDAGILILQENGARRLELLAPEKEGKGFPEIGVETLERVLEGQQALVAREHHEGGSVLALPLSCAKSGQGAILLYRKNEPFSNLELDLVRAIAGSMSSFLDSLPLPSLSLGEKGKQSDEESVLRQLIIGESPAVKNLRATIYRIRASDAPVLIVGESGTGKELVARAIHSTSSRSRCPFVVINCGAIPEHLLESELFGHARGAFTGALRDKPGLVEEADGGTLFLDEIGDLASPLQAKLLRLIQEREFRRVGETRVRHSNVRFLSATNRHLEEEIREGRFREDLYYRLKIITIDLPPLRMRKEDLPLLIDHFTDFFCRQMGRPKALFSPQALERLLSYDWPGNIRELQNEIQRCLILGGSSGIIEESDLSSKIFPEKEEKADKVSDFFAARADFERRFLRAALARYGYNRTRTAGCLGLSRQGLSKLLKKHRIMEKGCGAGSQEG